MKSGWFLLFLGVWGLVGGGPAAHAADQITVDVYAQPGAPTPMIRDLVFNTETPAVHHDVWILEGGVNDVVIWGTDTPFMLSLYLGALTAVADYATSCGATLFIQELTPVIPEVLDNYSDWTHRTAPNEPKVEMMNRALAAFAATRHIPVIRLYDAFKPHWTATPESWCLYQGSDGIHPNAIGFREIGRKWAEGILERVLAMPQEKVRVAVFGDSITAATYMAESQRPAAWLQVFFGRLSNPTAVSAADWTRYR